jgi:hypothetical protein
MSSAEPSAKEPEPPSSLEALARNAVLRRSSMSGPAGVPVGETRNLLRACETGGRTFFDGAGMCQGTDLPATLELGIGNAVTREDFRTPRLPLCRPDLPELQIHEDGRIVPLVPGPLHVPAVQSGVIYVHRQEVVVRAARPCLAHLQGSSAFGVPLFPEGKPITLRQSTKHYAEGDVDSYVEIRDETGAVLWAEYSGSLAHHATFGLRDVTLTRDSEPTCKRDSDDPASPNQYHGVTFSAGGSSCHLDPVSANCCTLFDLPFRVAHGTPGTNGLSYTLARESIFVEATPFLETAPGTAPKE